MSQAELEKASEWRFTHGDGGVYQEASIESARIGRAC